MNNDDIRNRSVDGVASALVADVDLYAFTGDRQSVGFADFGEDYEESERDTDYIVGFEEEFPIELAEEPVAKAIVEQEIKPEFEQTVEEKIVPVTCLAPQKEDDCPVFSLDRQALVEDSEVAGPATGENEYPGTVEDSAGAVDDDPDAVPRELLAEGRQGRDSWPLALIIVGLVAVVQLVMGGFALLQQRSASQDEIRYLRATLATAARPAELAAAREALQEMEQKTAEIVATIDVLTLYNERLTEELAGLEQKLAAQLSTIPGASQPEDHTR